MTDAVNPEQPTPPPAPPAAGASYPPPAEPPQYAPPAYPTAGYGQSGYAQPVGYGQPGGYGAGYGYGPVAPTNVLSIISLIASIAGLSFIPFIGSVVGVITGHMSLKQLRTSGEKGRGMALAGTIIGWVGLGLCILGVILFFAWFALVAGSVATTTSTWS